MSQKYTISVAVTGLTGTLVLIDDKGDKLTFTANGTKTFATSYSGGTVYHVDVLIQPTGQMCSLTNTASDPITSNVTITATCVTFVTTNLGPIYVPNTSTPVGQVSSPNNKFDVQLTPNLNTVHGVSFVDTNQWGPFYTTV